MFVGLEVSYFILYVLLMLFMDINLEISWTPIAAYKNIEGKDPEKLYFQFFVMTSLWRKIFEIVLKCSFCQIFRHILWKFRHILGIFWELHILVKSSSFSKSKFLFFSFYYFFIFYIFENLLTSTSFLFQTDFSIFPFFIILAFQKYIVI